MTLPRYDATRDANEAEIVEALERVPGVTVERLSGEDLPDLIVGYRLRNYLLEVKLPIGPKGGESHSKLSPGQKAWHKGWCGQRAVVRSAWEALSAIGARR